MPIEFECEECGATLRVADSKAGARGKCPTCQAALTVPETNPHGSEDATDPWDNGDWERAVVDDGDLVPPPRTGQPTSPSASSPSAYTYQSRTSLVWAITILMGIYMLAMLAYGAASLYQLSLLKKLQAGQNVGEESLEMSDSLVLVPACGSFLVILALAVVWCVWKASANRNARAISGRNLEYTPGWAAGCYFVPIANLVWPYNAMKEIWENSSTGASTGLLGLWWGLWIISGIVGRIESRLGMRADTVDELVVATQVGLLGTPLALAAAVAALMVVWRIQTIQEQAVDIPRV